MLMIRCLRLVFRTLDHLVLEQRPSEDAHSCTWSFVGCQGSRCDRLEKEITAVRELAKSFVAYANQKYNSLRLELEDAQKLTEDYRT